MRTANSIRNTALSILILLFVLETMSQIAFHVLEHSGVVNITTLTDRQKRWLQEHLDDSTLEERFDRELGWTNLFDSDRVFADTSQQGLRGKKIYPVDKGERPRIAELGDSFTFGDKVRSGETWPNVLEESNPGVDVLNFGVNGYGVDQSYWRYQRDVRQFDPDIVILGVLVSTADRQANVFRPYCHPGGSELLTKPRYKLVGDEIVYLDNQFKTAADFETLLTDEISTSKRLGENDYCFKRKGLTVANRFPASFRWPTLLTQRVSKEDDIEKLTVVLIKKFYLELEAEGRSLVVVLLNSMRSLNNPGQYRLSNRLEEQGIPLPGHLDRVEIRHLTEGHFNSVHRRQTSQFQGKFSHGAYHRQKTQGFGSAAGRLLNRPTLDRFVSFRQ